MSRHTDAQTDGQTHTDTHIPFYFRNRRAKGGAIQKSRLVHDDLVDFIIGSEHSGGLGCNNNNKIIYEIYLNMFTSYIRRLKCLTVRIINGFTRCKN